MSTNSEPFEQGFVSTQGAIYKPKRPAGYFMDPETENYMSIDTAVKTGQVVRSRDGNGKAFIWIKQTKMPVKAAIESGFIDEDGAKFVMALEAAKEPAQIANIHSRRDDAHEAAVEHPASLILDAVAGYIRGAVTKAQATATIAEVLEGYRHA